MCAKVDFCQSLVAFNAYAHVNGETASQLLFLNNFSCEPQESCHQSPKRDRLKVHLGPFSGFWWINDTYLWN